MLTSKARQRHNKNLPLYIKNITKVFLFMVFLVVLYNVVETCKQYFPIKSVKVYGVHHLDQQAMQQSLLPLVSKGFFAIRVETIKDDLLKSPWVAKASVQRVWPDKVLITVVEKKPVALWNSDSLISNNGEIFTPDNMDNLEPLPTLVGPEGQQISILEQYKKLNNLLLPLHFKIERLELTPEHCWSVKFDNGMKLSVGYKDVLTRMTHFVKVYPKIIGDRATDVDYVDLRYSNGLAVKWKTIT
jgi:cell division protein FtsQ